MHPRVPSLLDEQQISVTIRGGKSVVLKMAGQAVIPQVKLIGTRTLHLHYVTAQNITVHYKYLIQFSIVSDTDPV